MFLRIKNREDNDIIEDILEKRYGWAYNNKNDIIGYISAKHGQGYNTYIIIYEVNNFPISDLDDKITNNWEDFCEDMENSKYEYYLQDYFDGKIENVTIN